MNSCDITISSAPGREEKKCQTISTGKMDFRGVISVGARILAGSVFLPAPTRFNFPTGRPVFGGGRDMPNPQDKYDDMSS